MDTVVLLALDDSPSGQLRRRLAFRHWLEPPFASASFQPSPEQVSGFKGFGLLLTSFLTMLLGSLLPSLCLVFVVVPLISHVPIRQKGYPRRQAPLLSYLLTPPNLELSVVGVYSLLPARISDLTGPSLIPLEHLVELVRELAIEIDLDQYDLGPRLADYVWWEQRHLLPALKPFDDLPNP
jgi:hypothetical protein